MKKLNKKLMNVMATAALVASVAAPFSASANSTNVVNTVPSVDDDYVSGVTPLTTLTVKEDDTTFTAGQVFRILLPAGVEFVEASYTNTAITGATIVTKSKQVLELSIDATGVTNKKVELPLFIDIEGASGALKLTVDPIDSTITAGEYTFANVANGDTVTTIDDVKTAGTSASDIGLIRIDETAIGAMSKSGRQKVSLKLPSDFNWESGTIQFAGGFAETYDDDNNAATPNVPIVKGIYAAQTGGASLSATNSYAFNNGSAIVIDDRTLEFYFELGATPTKRGSIYISGAQISADTDADYGDVSLSVSGDEVSSEDVVIAKYADYGFEVKATDDVEELIAGRLGNSDKEDIKLATLKIKENVAGSLVNGRKTTITLPADVKIVDVKAKKATNLASTSALEAAIKTDIVGDSNEVEFQIPNTVSNSVKTDMEIEFYVTTKANFSGDITAKISGHSGIVGEAVLAKVVKPVSVKVTPNDVKIGVKGQQLGDIIISENVKGAIQKSNLLVVLDGEWGSKPKVEVIEGDLEIDEDNITKSGGTITIPIKSESGKVSKIKLSGGTIDLDRMVAVGDLKVKVRGGAVNETHYTNSKGYEGEAALAWNVTSLDKAATTDGSLTTKDAGEFEASNAADAVIAHIITPAPDEVSNLVKFTIDTDKYTVNGVEKTADVAPFIQDGRTFLPIRYVAEAVGVTDANIIWNANTKTVTLIKGDRIAQVKLGRKTLTVNGVAVQMDTVASVKNGRTVLPLRFVTQALGAEVQWDETTKTVTIK